MKQFENILLVAGIAGEVVPDVATSCNLAVKPSGFTTPVELAGTE